MEGPTTLAAPLLILNAKKLSGQSLLSPHLVFGTPGKVTQHSHRGGIWGGDWFSLGGEDTRLPGDHSWSAQSLLDQVQLSLTSSMSAGQLKQAFLELISDHPAFSTRLLDEGK